MIAAFRKHLSAPGLLKTLWSCFQKGAESPPPGKVEIALVDALMAGLAVFGLKYPSAYDICGGTCSGLGRRCRDTLANLKKTCCKLGISFW
jgi:hypothetical protein